MENLQADNVLILSKQIRSLLALCQNSSLLSMLQWIVGHPLLRPHQLSLAFFELTPEMTWEFVKGAGPVPLGGLSGTDDAKVCDLRIADRELPWGFFNWNDFNFEGMNNEPELSLAGLCLGEHEYSDGLLVVAAKNEFKFESFAHIYSFIRVASEFVYRHHYLNSSSDMELHSKRENPNTETSVPDVPEEPGSSLVGVVLTDRQSHILEYISSGLTNEEIAAKLHLSLGTIRVEASRLYDRLGARNRQQAASLAHLVLDQ